MKDPVTSRTTYAREAAVAARLGPRSPLVDRSAALMTILEPYPFLRAAIEDMILVSDLIGRDLGSSRNLVSLLYDVLEFVLYEALLANGEDIYKNGQNTIGLDAAIGRCKGSGIDLPLLGTIRSIQKHRGDAKHHAQTPHDEAFAPMMDGFRVIVSRLIHERFGQVLGHEVLALPLLPYHDALYQSYRKYRTHNWMLALRCALGALLHKHRAVLGIMDDRYAGGLEEAAILDLLKQQITSAPQLPAPANVLEAWKALPDEVAKLVADGRISDAAELAGRGYAKVEGLLPGIFDIRSARRITDRLFQPKALLMGGAWTEGHGGDTDRMRIVREELRSILLARPDLVRSFGRPFYWDEEEKGSWQWWEFAVFDDTRWHTFHLDRFFDLALEIGSFADPDPKRQEGVAELILAEFRRAAKLET
jgi:hypothetical protein